MRRGRCAAAALHGRSDLLRHNRQLEKALHGLYSREGAECALTKVDRFLDEHSDALRTVYRRHAELGIAPCLDEFEGVLVLERLQNDRAHLVNAWPFPEEELQVVADAAGVRLTLS